MRGPKKNAHGVRVKYRRDRAPGRPSAGQGETSGVVPHLAWGEDAEGAEAARQALVHGVVWVGDGNQLAHRKSSGFLTSVVARHVLHLTRSLVVHSRNHHLAGRLAPGLGNHQRGRIHVQQVADGIDGV